MTSFILFSWLDSWICKIFYFSFQSGLSPLMPGDNCCKFVEVCTLVFQSQDFKWSLTFIYVLTLFFTIPVIDSLSSCRLGLTEQNLTEARLTVSSTERLLRYFYCIFTLTYAVLPSFKERLCPLTPTGGEWAYNAPLTMCCHFTTHWHIFFLFCKKLMHPHFFCIIIHWFCKTKHLIQHS